MMMRLRVLSGIFALVASASPALAATCGGAPSGWKTSRPHGQVINTLAIDDAKPATWNGSPVTREQVRQYVGLTKELNPVPTLLLVVSPAADCAEVRTFRQMIDTTLDCKAGQCVEVGP